MVSMIHYHTIIIINNNNIVTIIVIITHDKPVSIKDDIAVPSKEDSMFLLWHLDKVEHLDAEHLHILDF